MLQLLEYIFFHWFAWLVVNVDRVIHLQTNQQLAPSVSVKLTKLRKTDVIANSESHLSKYTRLSKHCNMFDLTPGRGKSGGAAACTEDRRLGEGDLARHVNVKEVDLPGLNWTNEQVQDENLWVAKSLPCGHRTVDVLYNASPSRSGMEPPTRNTWRKFTSDNWHQSVSGHLMFSGCIRKSLARGPWGHRLAVLRKMLGQVWSGWCWALDDPCLMLTKINKGLS